MRLRRGHGYLLLQSGETRRLIGGKRSAVYALLFVMLKLISMLIYRLNIRNLKFGTRGRKCNRRPAILYHDRRPVLCRLRKEINMRNFVPAAYSHCGGNGAAVRVSDGLRLPSLIWKIGRTEGIPLFFASCHFTSRHISVSGSSCFNLKKGKTTYYICKALVKLMFFAYNDVIRYWKERSAFEWLQRKKT